MPVPVLGCFTNGTRDFTSAIDRGVVQRMAAQGAVLHGEGSRNTPPMMASPHVLWLPIIAGFMTGWSGISAFSSAPRLVSGFGGSLLALVCWTACHVSTLAVQRISGNRLPLIPLLALGVLASGIFMIPGYYAVYEMFQQMGYSTKGWAAIRDYSVAKGVAATPGTMLFWVSFNYMLFRFGVPRFGFGEAPNEPTKAAAALPSLDPLIAKLRPEIRGPILAVQAEAHFIRVYTTRGEDLVHHRFGDAVSALSALPGKRVHRSWWVASGAIDPHASSSSQLVLSNGLRVPVGRTYKLDAQRAGLLA